VWAESGIGECQTWWYVKKPLGFKSLKTQGQNACVDILDLGKLSGSG